MTGDTPKPMVNIHGRPFIDIMLDPWIQAGLSKLILALGYKPERFVSFFGSMYRGVAVEYVIEEKALGTGGALFNALDSVETESFWATNADTFLSFEPAQIMRQLDDVSEPADISVAIVQFEGDRYSGVATDSQSWLTSFNASPSNVINAGVYAFRTMVARELRDRYSAAPRPLSLENDVMPAAVRERRVYGEAVDAADFVDIGIPRDFAKFDRWYGAQHGR